MSLLRASSVSLCLLLVSSSAIVAQQSSRKEPAIYNGPGSAERLRSLPPSRSYSLAKPRTFALGALSADENKLLGPVGFKQRIGVHRSIPNSLDAGTWSTLPDGGSVWQLAVRSDGAAGVRVHISDFSVGEGKLWVHAGDSIDGPYTGEGPYGNGEFWTGTVEGESVTIEYQAAPGVDTAAPVPFRIRSVAHQARLVGRDVEPPRRPLPFSAITNGAASNERGSGIDNAASCNLDIKCYPDWDAARRSVAHIQFEETQGDEQGTFLCSASLVATRDNSFKPYLLTAGHCIHDEAAARSLQTFWQYESPGCNQGPPATRGTVNSTNGGHLLAWATIYHGDYSLVLLPDVPSGVVFNGWDIADPAIGATVTGVHHPMGSYKRISFGATSPGIDVDVEGDPAPADRYTIVNYVQGITQPGSSGSPLFTAPGVVVGMLTYGPAEDGEVLCASGDLGGYGKFSNAYPNLSDYLENLPSSTVTPSASTLNFTGLNHVITGATVQTVTLTVPDTSTVTFKLSTDASWLRLSALSGSVSAASPFKLQVSVDPKYLVTADTFTTAIAIQSVAAPLQFINVKVTMKIDASNVTVSAIPNPVLKANGAWSLKLHLEETGGAATKLTGLRIDGADYSSNIAGWFGGNNLAAKGTLEGVISTSGLLTPVDKYFEFFGQDATSGQRWYRTLTVTFK